MWVYNVPRQRLQVGGNNWPQTRLREGQNKAPAQLVMWEQRYVICVCTRRRIKNREEDVLGHHHLTLTHSESVRAALGSQSHHFGEGSRSAGKQGADS